MPQYLKIENVSGLAQVNHKCYSGRMDPQLNPQPSFPEQQPLAASTPEAPLPAPAEQIPVPQTTPAGPSPLAPQPVAMPPVSPAMPPVQPQATPPLASGPAIADDVDVIEKEWVDETNRVIKATANDPYVEEKALEDLQVDYLKKRYGKEVAKDQDPAEQQNPPKAES